MQKTEQIEKINKFLDEVICKELINLEKADTSIVDFVILGQTIEVLGALLDKKPMKAKGQSMKRFDRSVRYLFGGRYRILNVDNKLYDKLRNQMTHTFIPSGDLLLIKNNKDNDYRNLEFRNGTLVLVASQFTVDIINACKRLKSLLNDGKIVPKNISYYND